MTVISIDDFNIRVEGHTGYAPLGEDIACAGLSALTYALGQWAERNADKAVGCAVDIRSGAASIYFEPREGCAKGWYAVREAFILGCEGMCDLFPDHVTLIDN